MTKFAGLIRQLVLESLGTGKGGKCSLREEVLEALHRSGGRLIIRKLASTRKVRDILGTKQRSLSIFEGTVRDAPFCQIIHELFRDRWMLVVAKREVERVAVVVEEDGKAVAVEAVAAAAAEWIPGDAMEIPWVKAYDLYGLSWSVLYRLVVVRPLRRQHGRRSGNSGHREEIYKIDDHETVRQHESCSPG